jgi:hypothetical protein
MFSYLLVNRWGGGGSIEMDPLHRSIGSEDLYWTDMAQGAFMTMVMDIQFVETWSSLTG